MLNKKWESDEIVLTNCIMVTDVATRLPSHILIWKMPVVQKMATVRICDPWGVRGKAQR